MCPPVFMEKLDLQFDPLTGLQTTSFVDEEGTLHVNYKQDAEAAFEAAHSIRKDDEHWRRGVKKSMVHAMHIPLGVVLELKTAGIDVYTAPLKEITAGLRRIGRYEACDLTGKRLV